MKRRLWLVFPSPWTQWVSIFLSFLQHVCVCVCVCVYIFILFYRGLFAKSTETQGLVWRVFPKLNRTCEKWTPADEASIHAIKSLSGIKTCCGVASKRQEASKRQARGKGSSWTSQNQPPLKMDYPSKFTQRRMGELVSEGWIGIQIMLAFKILNSFPIYFVFRFVK